MPKRSSDKKPIPKFGSEQEAAEFWNTHDSAEYVDWDKATVHAEHAPPMQSISIRFPAALLSELKRLAGKRDVAYQALIKMYVADRVDEELGRGRFMAKKRKAG